MITDRHKANLEAHLTDVAEAAGLSLTAETFPTLLYQEWDTVIDAAALEAAKKSDTRELAKLRADKIVTDLAATAIDARIAELTRGVSPR